MINTIGSTATKFIELTIDILFKKMLLIELYDTYYQIVMAMVFSR